MDPIDRRRRLVAGLLAAGTLGTLAGCGGKAPMEPPPPGPPPELRISVSAAANANRGPGGKGLPVVVRLYELKARGAFDRADFYSVYDKESATLDGELVGREESTLAPSTERLVVRTLDPATRYLGVVAAFREIDRATWRAVLELRPGKNNNVAVTVGSNAVSVQPL
jgi:type VI secretion system protein VasD